MLTALAPPLGADSALTLYRSDSDMLFDNGTQPVNDGHAVVHEQRSLAPAAGRGEVRIEGLPSLVDTAAVTVELDTGRVLAQRVLSAADGSLAAHRGQHVQVLAADGRSLAEGVLTGHDGNLLGVRGDDGRVRWLRDFGSVSFPQGSGQPGSTLVLVVDGSGSRSVRLTYPTAGLGWRAAYSALLLEGRDCRLRLESLATIANRSGRDYPSAQLKLVAGAPALNRGSYAPRGMMKAMAVAAAPDELPEQASLGDYRSYTVDGTLDLPDASVTQVPLYAARELACERRWLVESGGAWFPSRPMLESSQGGAQRGPVTSRLQFRADENLPAGQLRVLTRDRDGRIELLGESRLGDTPKGQPVSATLGIAFDLVSQRERTAFSIDRDARRMDEGFRVTVRNTGDTARTVTVREHPNRWRNWTLVSSSLKPKQQTPDTLEFDLPVPAGGEASVDWLLRYSWLAGDE